MRRRAAIHHLLCCAMLCGAGCRAREPDRPRGPRPAVTTALGRPAILATVPELESAPASEEPTVVGLHPTHHALAEEFVFSERGGGVAFALEKDGKFQVVHGGRAGKRYDAVGAIALSPDGSRCAHGALAGGKWRMVVDGVEGRPFDTVRSPVFSPDGAHVAYQAMDGARWHLVVDGTVNGGTRTRYLGHAFGGDASRIAFVDDVGDDETGRLVVSDLGFQEQTVVAANVSRMVLDADRKRIAAVARSDGRQGVLTVALARPDVVERGPLRDSVQGIAFSPDGGPLAYVAERSGERILVLDGNEEKIPGADMILSPVPKPGGKSAGAFVVSGGSVALRHFFGERTPPEPGYEEAEGLVYSDDGRFHAYAARRGASWFVVVNGREGPPFDRVVTPLFTPDGKLVVYRARKDGKRFVVTADTSGRTVRQHEPYEQVFPVLFTADGRSIAYGVKDGRQLAWKVEAP